MISEQMIATSVLRLSECMTYFPQSPVLKVELARMLPRMIGSADIRSAGSTYSPEQRLNWLTEALIHGVGKWPEEGLKQIRGLYCCRFKPADKHEEACSLLGFSGDPEDGPQSSFLSAPPVETPYVLQEGDEPIGEELQQQLKQLVAAKTVKGGK